MKLLRKGGEAIWNLPDNVVPVGGATQYINNQVIPTDRTLDVTIDSTAPAAGCDHHYDAFWLPYYSP